MRERGIIFSGPMVRAILEGRKSQTRRVMKNPPTLMDKVCAKLFRKDYGGRKCPYGIPGDRLYVREAWRPVDHHFEDPPQSWLIECRADREVKDARAHWCNVPDEDLAAELVKKFGTADTTGGCDPRWRPSIHMPKWASRIWLEIVGVRVERVQEISEENAIAEGLTEYFWPKDLPPEVQARVEGKRYWEPVIKKRSRRTGVWDSSIKAFRELWDDVNGKRESCAWKDNPWVWVIAFRRIEP